MSENKGYGNRKLQSVLHFLLVCGIENDTATPFDATRHCALKGSDHLTTIPRIGGHQWMHINMPDESPTHK